MGNLLKSCCCCTSTYLEYKNIARCAIYIEFTIRRIVRVDALTGKEIYNIYWSIYIAIGSRNLQETEKRER